MTVEEIQKRIADTTASRDALLPGLDSAANRLKAAFSAFAKDWVPKEAADVAKRQANVTQALGAEVSAVKAEVNELVTKLAPMMEKKLNDEQCWKHRRRPEPPKSTRPQYGGSMEREPEPLEMAYREILGTVGELLKKHGYKIDWVEGSPARYAYRLPSEEDPAVKEATTAYNSQMVKFSDLTKSLERLAAELAEAKAKKLWDDA